MFRLRGNARRRVSRVLSRLRTNNPRAVMAIPLGRSSPSASCDPPEQRRGGSPSIPDIPGCLPLLFGLAPGGVFPATTVAGGAVRSYRTVSPLPPARSSRDGRRCTFCGTFPRVAPAGCYPAPYLRGARTFLSPPRAESGHPAVWHERIWGPPTALSKIRCGVAHENPSGSAVG
jgi:hypothetical protein